MITDVVMPGMTGVELAEEVVRLSPGIRVLLCSGYTRDALAASGGERRPAGGSRLPAEAIQPGGADREGQRDAEREAGLKRKLIVDG